jgi:hypothetical protein
MNVCMAMHALGGALIQEAYCKLLGITLSREPEWR